MKVRAIWPFVVTGPVRWIPAGRGNVSVHKVGQKIQMEDVPSISMNVPQTKVRQIVVHAIHLSGVLIHLAVFDVLRVLKDIRVMAFFVMTSMNV